MMISRGRGNFLLVLIGSFLLSVVSMAEPDECRGDMYDVGHFFAFLREGLQVEGDYPRLEEIYLKKKRRLDELNNAWREGVGEGPGSILYDKAEEEFIHAEALFEEAGAKRDAYRARVAENDRLVRERALAEAQPQARGGGLAPPPKSPPQQRPRRRRPGSTFLELSLPNGDLD